MFFFFFYFYFKNKKIKKSILVKKRQAFQDWELKIRKHRIAVRASTPKKSPSDKHPNFIPKKKAQV